MEIILTKQCAALTGSLGKGFGYYIRRARHQDGSVHFFSQRSKHPPIPRDGHLRFILACAKIAQMKTHITDIRLPRKELTDAIWEAGFHHLADFIVTNPKICPDPLHADDTINFYNYWFK